MSNYSKKSLRAQVNATKRKIKELSLDKKGTASLLDELLSLQSQMDVEPTELIIPTSEVVATYDFEAFQIIKCKTCIIFKCTGYRLIAKPLYNQGVNGGALYSQLESLCDMKDHFDEQDDETKDLYTLVFNITITILSLPLDAFVDDNFLFSVAKFIVEKKTELYKKIINTPLQDETKEDVMKNQQYEEVMMAAEEMKKESQNKE